MTFRDLNLIPPILRAAEEIGYQTPSPIQRQAIPPVLAGRDLLGCAQTGTGKTAAFAMPILQRLRETPAPNQGGKKRPIRALILTPTRELALQIDESFADYGRHLPLAHCVIFGGVNQNPQVERLRQGVDILTATPGRLNDLIGQGYIDLDQIEIFVLDEADRMLDMGFVHDVKRVITHLPKQRQTLLFSATMPREIEELAESLLHKPEKVMVTPPATTVESIEQSVYFVDKGNKRHLLAKLLQSPEVTSALVFTRTKHGADRVVRELARAGIGAMAIHGNKSQNARQDALAKFKDGRIRVLVATDIAARGIDVNGLSHVFNYDLPNIPETYVHRIGRTGRAGRAGIAISFCDFEEQEYLADIEKLTRIHIPCVEHEWPMQIFEKAEKAPQRAPKAGGAHTGKQPAPQHKENAPMEQKNTLSEPQTATAPTESAPGKKRRRRGGRRHKSAAPQAAVQIPAEAPAQKQGGQASKQNSKQSNQSRAPKAGTNGQEPRGQKGKQEPRGQKNTNGNGGQEPRGQKSGNGKQTDAARAPQRPAEKKPARAASHAEPTEERDDSLQVIARRAPAQKYANFEEYMKAHG